MSPDGGQLRLFVALALPAEAVTALEAFAAAAAAPETWRRLPAGSLHMTLVFLGRRPAAEVPAIARVLDDCAGPGPRLRLDSALLLPPRRPRTLGVAVAEEAGAELAALQRRCAEGLAAGGMYEPERRPFRAHVTVARLRRDARAPQAAPPVAPERVSFRAGGLALMRSLTGPSGAEYTALHSVALA